MEGLHRETQGRPPAGAAASCEMERPSSHLLATRPWKPKSACKALVFPLSGGGLGVNQVEYEVWGRVQTLLQFPPATTAWSDRNDLKTVQQLLEYWPELCTPYSLNLLACKSNFEAVEWLHDSRPQDYFIDIQLTSCSHRRRLGLDDVQWVAWLAFEVAWSDQWRPLA